MKTGIALLAVGLALLLGVVRPASAGVITYDTRTEAGDVILSFAYDADVDEKLRFRGNRLDVSDLFAVSLMVGGRAYDLGAPLTGRLVFDRKAGTLTYIASDAALAAGAPASRFTLFFGGRVKVRRFSELVGVLSTLTPEEIEVLLTEAALPVPLPAAAWLFALGGAVLTHVRVRPRRSCQAA